MYAKLQLEQLWWHFRSNESATASAQSTKNGKQARIIWNGHGFTPTAALAADYAKYDW